jgi:predicted anti-sigma-YlaC factor YlaD
MLESLKRWTKNEHALCQEDLSAYLDGRLDPGRMAQVQKHLKSCTKCRADLATLRHTVALLKKVPAVRPPRSFLLPAIAVAKPKRVPRPSFAYAGLRLATAVATVLLVLVVSGDALLRFAGPVPGTLVSRFGGEPTAVVLEEPAVGDETEGATLGAPQAAATAPRVESQSQPVAQGVRTPVEELQPMAAGETDLEPTAGLPENQLAAQTKTRPSHPSAVPAAPPSVPTSESAAPSPMPQAALLTATLVPPTVTPVPPTPLPEPTATAQPPTAAPMAIETAVTRPVQPDAGPPSQGAHDLIRSILPWAELVLAIVTSVLLAVTLWMRRRQGTT